MEQYQFTYPCITCKQNTGINWNFGNSLFLLIYSNFCHKKMLLESLTIPLISSILACLALEAWTHESKGGAVEINRNLQKFWGPLWNYPTLFTFLTTLSRWLILNKCVFILISEVINKEFFISAGKEFPRGWDIPQKLFRERECVIILHSSVFQQKYFDLSSSNISPNQFWPKMTDFQL